MQKIKILAFSLLLGLAACSGQQTKTEAQNPAADSAAAGGASKPGKGIATQALQTPLVEETFQTLIVDTLLKELGYEPKPIKEVDYSAAYTAIANGDATYTAAAWMPLQEDMYANSGGDKKFFRKGTFIANAASGYMIDKKTADRYKITSIDQLADPKLAKLFDADGDGKADLAGCQTGWNCEKTINQQIRDYKLGNTVTQKQGQYSALIADVMARFDSGKPVLYYTWTPYWVSARLVPGKDVVWLQVPFTSYPGIKDTTAPDGKNYGFATNSELIIANKAFTDANPAAAKLFELAKIPVADISVQNILITQGEDKPEHIQKHADNWIKANRATVDGWLTEARAAAAAE